jgi:peptidoglycan/xylan/chitin deacetylase (PgdA/CDA1 family)
LKNGREKSRFAVFTFDDGFRDTYELAYPIFSKHNAPFTVYVTTAVPDNDFIWWHYMLDDLVYRNDLLDITLLGERRLFESKTAKQKFHAYKAIDGLVNSIEPDHRREALETIFTSYGLNSAVYAQKLSMTWDQIRELSRSRLATIGSHTVNHPNLALMSPQAAVDEMERGRMRIRDKLGIPVDHFCYPYGGKSAARCREFDLVKSLCFKTATTTRYGYITYRHHTAMERLPRIMVDMSTTIQGILP